MLLTQVFKTGEGARKRAAFENAHCGSKYHYFPVRCINNRPDTDDFDASKFNLYTWRLERKTK